MSYPPITELVAHRGTMLLIDQVESVSPGSITVSARVRQGLWYSDQEGVMPAWIGIEMMARAIAALVGYEIFSDTEAPRPGLLLGTRSYHASEPLVGVGEKLLISANREFHDSSGLAAFKCSIEYSGGLLAESTLKVFDLKPGQEVFD